MKKILVIGAGRSSHSLIDYLLDNAMAHDWKITIADRVVDTVKTRIKEHKNAEAVILDVMSDENLCAQLIKASELVVSMLPAHMHHIVARYCIDAGVHMVTASYVSPEIRALDKEAKRKNVLLLMETGLDPGIDHMSAMQEIDNIKKAGGKLLSFKSFTGGLIAPESDDNPWHYKFTWNPRNVVLAGQGVARFLRNHRYKYIPYQSLFTRLEKVEVKGWGTFEGYANRDSLGYREVYGITDIPTIFRGTLRRPGFCEAWQVFVQLGMTDDSYLLEDIDKMTYRDFINSYLVYKPDVPVEAKLCEYLKTNRSDPRMEKLEWLGIFEHKKINMAKATPAQVLQKLLEEKWQLKQKDKDMIVMQHQFEYELGAAIKKSISSMVITGENARNTAMAKTVGWPLGIAVKLVLDDKIKLTGVQLPVKKEIYEPILSELRTFGVNFDTEEA